MRIGAPCVCVRVHPPPPRPAPPGRVLERKTRFMRDDMPRPRLDPSAIFPLINPSAKCERERERERERDKSCRKRQFS